jgi:hypothetical protein
MMAAGRDEQPADEERQGEGTPSFSAPPAPLPLPLLKGLLPYIKQQEDTNN